MKGLARSLGEGLHGAKPETSLAGEVISTAIRGPLCAISSLSRPAAIGRLDARRWRALPQADAEHVGYRLYGNVPC